MKFKFGEYTTEIIITQKLPGISVEKALFVCDENTKQYADILRGSKALCVIESGEQNKNWDSVFKILRAAKDANLGRDGVLVGVGGGVIGDLTAFAASVYMRGCRLKLVATTLLAMADASIGGKTGFDLFDIKNLAGTFYPAETVYMPLETLKTLQEREYKSGMAELIKTMILTGQEEDKGLKFLCSNGKPQSFLFPESLSKAVKFKAKIASSDFKETKGKRALLNLGHTFGHALETSAGLGNITHGEAVAWGILQACSLGASLNITPKKRAEVIKERITELGYNFPAPHPLSLTDSFKNALFSDKKKKSKSLAFVVPDKKSARLVYVNNEDFKITGY